MARSSHLHSASATDSRTPAADDSTLAARIRSGDSAAFETVFRTYYSRLYAIAFAYLHSADLAEDAVQNVFRAVWVHRATWWPAGALGPYLRTAVRNESLNELRGALRQRFATARAGQLGEAAGTAEPPVSIDDRIAAADLAQVVRDVAGCLAPRCQEVFLLKWERGLTYPEIARCLGISVKTVEMQMTRALKAIRPRVERLR